MKESWHQAFKHKLIEPGLIEETVLKLKNAGKQIATLNGSFDLLHAGHLHIIYEASQVADVLIVALNSDASIRKYKSAHRPLVPLNDRLQMMAALSFVDYVTWFEETDPRSLLSKIKPDVHVNGSEYGSSCLEAPTVKQHGGKIHIVSLVPGLSTTEIIKKIQVIPQQG
ncbi:MAG: adenylyltransferase/cytidyltransferase family protein [Parachlamydiaceae bacterium]